MFRERNERPFACLRSEPPNARQKAGRLCAVAEGNSTAGGLPAEERSGYPRLCDVLARPQRK